MLAGARFAARVRTARGIAVLLACGGCLPGIVFTVPAAVPAVVLFAVSYLIGGRGRAFSGSGTAVNAAGTIGNVFSGLLVTMIGARTVASPWPPSAT